jgi:hypothetical protein
LGENGIISSFLEFTVLQYLSSAQYVDNAEMDGAAGQFLGLQLKVCGFYLLLLRLRLLFQLPDDFLIVGFLFSGQIRQLCRVQQAALMIFRLWTALLKPLVTDCTGDKIKPLRAAYKQISKGALQQRTGG